MLNKQKFFIWNIKTMEILRYENNYTNIKIKYKQNKNDKKHVQHKLLHNPVVEVCVSKRFQPLHLYWHPSEVRFWMTSHWVYETSIVVHFVSHLHTHSFQYLTVHLSDIHLLSLYYRLTRRCFFLLLSVIITEWHLFSSQFVYSR